MNIKSVKINSQRLAEGQYYSFKIVKTISLNDEMNYFVLTDTKGYKILMPADFYKEYGFETGQIINCRVDKINCNGRIFLEPQHPVYEEGKIYVFDVIDSGIRKNILDEDEAFFVVEDKLGKHRTVNSTHLTNPQLLQQKQIECYVERIKKGMLFLRLANESTDSNILKVGEEYDFKVLEERNNPDDNLKYFILLGPDDEKHLLKKKYYTHYGIGIGDVLKCRVIKFNSEGYFFLEPKNPYYNIGEIFEFPIKRFEEIEYSDGFKQKLVVLEDVFKDEINVFIDDKEYETLKDKKLAKARIENIRKSRLELVLI
ncbi:MAG: hypothetical protein ACOCWC_02105 [Bacteroidota bacterium]